MNKITGNITINRLLSITIVIVFTFLAPNISSAHPGRTDSSGGHTCRTNCANWGLSTGEYHYHRSKGIPQAKEPIKSTYGANGTGYTSPAPEYKTPVSNVSRQTINTTLIPTIQAEKKGWISRFFNWLW